MRYFRGWRTLAWQLANAIVLTMSTFETRYAVPEAWEPFWLAAFVAGNVILRMDTRTPVGRAN
jgi:hypothetical protein